MGVGNGAPGGDKMACPTAHFWSFAFCWGGGGGLGFRVWGLGFRV